MNKWLIIFIFGVCLAIVSGLLISNYISNKNKQEIAKQLEQSQNEIQSQVNEILSEPEINKTKVENLNKTIVKDRAYWEAYWKTHPGSTGGGGSSAIINPIY